VARKSAHVRRKRLLKPAGKPARPRVQEPDLSQDEPIEAEIVARNELPGTEDGVEDQSAATSGGREDDPTAALTESPLPNFDSHEQAVVENNARGELVPVDPLSRYLAELRRFPVLSREQESEIARRYYKYHNPEDAYRLVTANLRLVVKIANEFARASRNLLDLIQEGNVGLMEAVKNFDPYRGIRFPSYAVWWVRAYIYRYLINNWRLVKIGTTQAQRKLFFNLRKESERLEAEGFTPQPKLLAQRMGVKESEVREMQERMAQSELSLDAPAGPDEDIRLVEAIPDTGWSPEETTAREEWRNFAHDKVRQFAATLKDKELEIFSTRLLAEEPPTLQEVGARFGISRERVRQIESRLKRRLKEFLKDQAPDIDRAEN
jgi:RNA polymerase sigma-32 factor